MIQATAEQQQVLAHRSGDLLVQARAGTGKTTTTTLHTKALITEERVSPRAILVTTFSRRGATDMKTKAAALKVPSGVQYRTLHGVAYKIIREARDLAAKRRSTPPAEIEVADGRKKWKVTYVLRQEITKAARALGLAKDSKGRPAGMRLGDVAREISLAKSALVEPTTWSAKDGTVYPAYLTWAQTREREPLSTGPAKLVDAVYAALEGAKKAPAMYDATKFKDDAGKIWLTFDDMIATTARAILQGANWVKPWRGAYLWTFVDEVQDNSVGQWVMAKHLSAGRNLVAIGDMAQAIFAFRGASPELMAAFGGGQVPKTLNLTNNFRSTPAILDVANRILRTTEGFTEGTELRAGRTGTLPTVVTASGYAHASEEATAVMEGIESEINGGADPEEIAVLYRTNAQAGALETAALQRGLRYRIAGTSFFDRAEVKTAVAYLRLALDAGDKGWERVYGVPLRGLGKAFLAEYPTLASAEIAANNGSMAARYRRGFDQLARHMVELRRLVNENLQAAIEYIQEDLGVRAHYRDEDAGTDDTTESDEVCQALLACATAMGSAKALIEYASDMAGERRLADPDGQTVNGPTPMITLSTVHRSKGLEWGTTYVVGLTAGTFPHAMASAEEEARLGYVALSRAKNALHVSYTDTTHTGQPGGPSSLLLETGLLGEDEAALTTSGAGGDEEEPAA